VPYPSHPDPADPHQLVYTYVPSNPAKPCNVCNSDIAAEYYACKECKDWNCCLTCSVLRHKHPFIKNNSGPAYTCTACKLDFSEGNECYRCETCEYIYCFRCYNEQEELPHDKAKLAPTTTKTAIEVVMRKKGIPQAQIEALAASFQVLDQDNSMKLSAKELAKVLKFFEVPGSAESQSLNDIIKEVDVSKSGGIVSNDYLAYMTRNINDEEGAKKHVTDELLAVFNAITVDGKYVTQDTLKSAMQLLGEDFTDEEIALLIESADSDGDHKLNFQEFSTMLSSL